MSLFEQASRAKLRFETTKGLVSVEDLWDLPLTSARSANLNDIAKTINRELKAAGDEDFVNPSASNNTTLQMKFEIVKHVINVRLAENEAAKTAADKRARKDRLMEIIAQKQDQQLQGASLEELQSMIAAL